MCTFELQEQTRQHKKESFYKKRGLEIQPSISFNLDLLIVHNIF